MTKREYQVCTNCVMDTTDVNIVFDANGVCNYCLNYKENIASIKLSKEDKKAKLKQVTNELKKSGKGKKYDCIVGLSGGADSSYLCHVLKVEMGVNPLVVIVDTGWNLKVADDNIKKIVDGLKLDSVTIKIDWEEMKDLQLAFLKSGVSYQDLPQDHAIFASLYKYAVKNNIKYVCSGSNVATEFVRPPFEWLYMNDLRMANDIHKKYGKVKLKTFPKSSVFKNKIYYPIVKGMKRTYPLDYVDYDDNSLVFLTQEYGWEPYARKHYENVFTRFFEGYYLPEKFGFDTRKNVLSSMILYGTISREEALQKLNEVTYTKEETASDKKIICDKLGLSISEFDNLMKVENKTFRDYKNSFWLIQLGIKILRLIGKEKRELS